MEEVYKHAEETLQTLGKDSDVLDEIEVEVVNADSSSGQGRVKPATEAAVVHLIRTELEAKPSSLLTTTTEEEGGNQDGVLKTMSVAIRELFKACFF